MVIMAVGKDFFPLLFLLLWFLHLQAKLLVTCLLFVIASLPEHLSNAGCVLKILDNQTVCSHTENDSWKEELPLALFSKVCAIE